MFMVQIYVSSGNWLPGEEQIDLVKSIFVTPVQVISIIIKGGGLGAHYVIMLPGRLLILTSSSRILSNMAGGGGGGEGGSEAPAGKTTDGTAKMMKLGLPERVHVSQVAQSGGFQSEEHLTSQSWHQTQESKMH